MREEHRNQPDAGADGLIEGRNAVIEALRAGTSIDKIYLARGETDSTLGHIASTARNKGIVVVEADRRKLDGMSRTHSHQGVIALAGVGAAHADQLAPVALHHHNALGAGGGGDVPQGRVGLPPGQIDLVDRGARPQGLGHGVAALDDAVGLPAGGRSALLHGLSCLSHWSDTGQQYTTRRRIKKAKIAAFLQKERWASPLVFHRKFTGFAAPFLVFSNSLCYNYNYFEY